MSACSFNQFIYAFIQIYVLLILWYIHSFNLIRHQRAHMYIYQYTLYTITGRFIKSHSIDILYSHNSNKWIGTYHWHFFQNISTNHYFCKIKDINPPLITLSLGKSIFGIDFVIIPNERPLEMKWIKYKYW